MTYEDMLQRKSEFMPDVKESALLGRCLYENHSLFFRKASQPRIISIQQLRSGAAAARGHFRFACNVQTQSHIPTHWLTHGDTTRERLSRSPGVQGVLVHVVDQEAGAAAATRTSMNIKRPPPDQMPITASGGWPPRGALTRSRRRAHWNR